MRSFGHADFDGAFEPGTVFRCPRRGRIAVQHVLIGDLVVQSGRVIACDPASLSWESDRIPFARPVRTGKHPVTLCVTDAEDRTDSNLVALAMVRFAAQKPVRWEMALLPGQDPATLPLGQFYGYGVDTRMGCFIDAETARPLSKDDVFRALDEAANALHPSLASPLPIKYGVGVVVHEPSGANIIVFDSGYGDGAYVSYWGIDTSGEPCCLVTDFGVLVEHLEGRATFLIRDCIGQQLSIPDLAQTGVTIRVPSLGEYQHQRHRVEAHGVTDNCDAKVMNADRTYGSSYVVRPDLHLGAWDFWFDEPLGPDATLTLKYGLGVVSLERTDGGATM